MTEDVVRDRLAHIGYCLHLLDRIRTMSFEEWHSDPWVYAGSLRYLQEAIEAALDVAQYLDRAHGWGRPKEYGEAMRICTEHLRMDEATRTRLVSMARFRNILVHEYADLDDRLVFSLLTHRLDDLSVFSQAVDRFLSADRQSRAGDDVRSE
ncbi:MAG TPA: DUF86 domain-containing protein [Firmicutes bacterium]|nr:DUF86 domain-containing protein [Bacillota bacterium]